MSSTIDLLLHATDNLKHKLCKVLSEEGVVQDEKLRMIGEILMTTPLKGLNTFQKQLTLSNTF